MEEELTLFRRMVQVLLQRPDRYTNARAADIAKEIRRLSLNPIVEPQMLSRLLPTADEVHKKFGERDFLYLRPVANDAIMVPVLWMDCDFSRSIPKISMLLGLFSWGDGDTVRGLGYRFETPEGQSRDGRGIHHYYHAQIIRSMRGINFPPQACSEWLPESQPAFPLDCQQPIHLLISLLVALYGRDEAFHPFHFERYLINQLKPHRAAMRFEQSLAVKWHWKIQNRDTGEIHKYYQSAREVDEYTEIKRQYPRCELVKILPSIYEASPATKKERLD